MIINSLIHVDKITSPISKEVKFKTVGNSYRGNYSQSYGKGLSNIDEIFYLTMANLTVLEVEELENLFLQQDVGKFMGFTPPNESTERPFYAPSTWDKEELHSYRAGIPETIYKLTFPLINYA